MPQITVPLTPQQQAVVAHNQGPALVFAVAGAGKTTAMIHRIERLVREELVAPERILATSFGATNIADLRQAMTGWRHCRSVDARTLHSLGRDIIHTAQQLGHLTQLNLNHGKNPAKLNNHLLNGALALARQQDVSYRRELDGLDQADFLDYVGRCKGNLQYADLKQVDLPPEAGRLAQQAASPSVMLDWYLDLYRLFEQVRQREGAVTFDDMLLTGWEALLRFPNVLSAVQARYQCVLVDEFQDINLAQSEILDQIIRPHGNYMAIGDDDQTVYEWRGANPCFILDFQERYHAQIYLIDDNFRCPAGPLALANQVIAHNKQRKAKRLNLTRGFGGQMTLQTSDSIIAMSQAMVNQIRAHQANGGSLNDIAVLVRLNAQTPPIEQALISADIPYRVGQPFYERTEIKTLIQYGRLAWLEKQLQTSGSRPLGESSVQQMVAAWQAVCNRPKRYIPNAVKKHVSAAIRRQAQPLSHTLIQLSRQVEATYLVDNLTQLAADIQWLAGQLAAEAHQTLRELERRLDYKEFLRSSSGLSATGEGKAASVAAFIAYARQQGALQTFMKHIRELEKLKTGQADGQTAVTLSTIHKAKGLEWPVTLIPECHDGIFPFGGQQADNREEERRLLYVAITRSRQDLHLYRLKQEPISPFLRQAHWEKTLADVASVQRLLTQTPATWDAAAALTLARAVPTYGWQRYFQQEWPTDKAWLAAVSQRMAGFYTAVKQKNLLARLRLKEAQLAWWARLAPATDYDLNFPGLDELAQQGLRSKRPSGSVAPPTEPALIRPGMWINCDAGWGKIEAIDEMLQRPLTETSRGNTMIRLRVRLRPDRDAELIEIDISASRIHFPNATNVYTCTKCNRFSAATANLITNQHNNVAHDGIGASFRQEKKPEIHLQQMRYQIQPPATPLV